MIKGSAEIKDNDHGMDRLMREVREGADHVDIGIQSDESETLLIIAGANEFGATINHPGGTAYGYKTQQDAKKGRVQFLKKGEGYAVLGETKPHTIVIPARPYIRSTVDQNADDYHRHAETLTGLMLDGELDKFEALSLMGQKIEADIKNQIINISSPPNARSTIRKKGSDNPLVDTGLLGGSIRYVVGTEEGGSDAAEVGS